MDVAGVVPDLIAWRAICTRIRSCPSREHRTSAFVRERLEAPRLVIDEEALRTGVEMLAGTAFRFLCS